jgi:thiol-disulfide isomerase/thioredoxin
MKRASRSSLFPLAVFLAVALPLFFHPSGGVLAKGAFEGYYAKFVHAARPEKAPDVPFLDAWGEKHSLSDFRGKVVLANIWATWCPACIVEMPQLDRLQVRLGGEDFMVLTISQDSGGGTAVRKFFDERNLTNLPIFIDKDRKLGRAFKQSLLPTSMLLDAEGRELGRIIGPAEWDSPEALAFIRRYLPGGGKWTHS